MLNNNGLPHHANWSYSGRMLNLPPRTLFPIVAQASENCGSGPLMGNKHMVIPHSKQHQRTASESFIIEEQPSWLDDLLNEPDMPVGRGTHQRSSSDSVALLDVPVMLSKIENTAEEEQELEKSGEVDTNMPLQGRESSFVDYVAPDVDPHDRKGCLDMMNCLQGKPVAPDTDPKRAKQHFAQRSRVRKLQYIAELERNVNLLYAEESDAAAELGFLKQQWLILILENKALKQRIASIAHEKQIKDFQYELLSKELERLWTLYHYQPQQHSESERPCGHAAADAGLELQLGSLSLHIEASLEKEPGGMNRGASYPCMMLQKS